MKKVITINDIRRHKENKNETLCIGAGEMLTPAARDLAAELSIRIVTGKEAETLNMEASTEIIGSEEAMVNHLVAEVLASMQAGGLESTEPVTERDVSGIRLIRGSTVVCERFDTGNSTDRVGIKEILSIKECPNMATGFMEIEKSSFDWTLGYDELDFIVEGVMDITINGKTMRGKAGDVFFIPMNTSITFSSPEYCKFFFSTYPANWQELSGSKTK